MINNKHIGYANSVFLSGANKDALLSFLNWPLCPCLCVCVCA